MLSRDAPPLSVIVRHPQNGCILKAQGQGWGFGRGAGGKKDNARQPLAPRRLKLQLDDPTPNVQQNSLSVVFRVNEKE